MNAAAFTASALARWRADPVLFIEEVLIDPETNKPFVLLLAEREFLQHAFVRDADGHLKYPELIYSCPKKSGKTTFAGLLVLAVMVLFGGAYPEAICCANAFEQATGRVFAMIKRIIKASPLLRADARITEAKITLAGGSITAIPSDYASAAGSNQNIAVFDELWAYDSERARRLFDELVPPPTRKVACRLTVTYAGFSSESELLEELYRCGLEQHQVAPNLYAGDGLLMAWHHQPIAPWQTPEWVEEMRRSLRPDQFARMIQNEFVSNESTFVNMSDWDACVQPTLTPLINDRRTHVWVGVDASTKRDNTALVACSYDRKTKCVVLIAHRVFTPTPGHPIDFEATVEATLLDWNTRYRLRAVWFDPFQMMSVAQRLTKAHIPIEEYPQTVPNLTATTTNLFDLIQARQLVLYPDAAMRLSVSRAIIVESSRGWRLDKLKQSHKIDVIVALSMAALAAVRGQEKSFYDLAALSGLPDPSENAANERAREYHQQLLAKFGQPVSLRRLS
jgi:phage terminase large subunit-like protein